MNRTRHEVWKYQFPGNTFKHTHYIPNGAKVVHYALQDDVPTVWYEVNPDRVKTERTFMFIMTGESFTIRDEYSPNYQHVGTFIIDWLVVHLYEVLE